METPINNDGVSRLKELIQKAEDLPNNGYLNSFREIKGVAEVIFRNELGKDSEHIYKLNNVSYNANYPGKKLKTILSVALEEIIYSQKSKTKVSESKVKTETVFCYHCNRETKQLIAFEKGEIIAPKEIIFFDKDGNRKNNGWTIEYRVWKLLQCQGCEKTNLNVYVREDPRQKDILIHHFPTKDFRPFPNWAQHLNQNYFELFSEIYLSLSAESSRLPLMGARTILDMFIVDKIGDVGSFKVKLKKLVEGNYISETNRELLEVALEYGHATIHRGYVPSKDEINGVFDIIETILHAEALVDKSKNLKKSIPKKS